MTEAQPAQEAPAENQNTASYNQPAVSGESSAPEDTFSNHPEVGEIIVDDKNRPFLVLDVNANDGSVIGLAFNVDGTSEVVTEHADNAD